MSNASERAVTFETKCWEKDWQHLLLTDRLAAMAKRNCYPFAERVLMINNVADYKHVCASAERAVQEGYITRYVVVEEYAKEVLDFFGLTREAFGRGYYFSIAELVSIYLCKTEFLLHYSSDAIAAHSTDWLPASITLFDHDPRVRVANLTWNNCFQEAQKHSMEENDNFYIGFGFSDQCYLIRPADFRARIYTEQHPASARYPGYAGELFEKRVDSWMRNHNFLRATYRHASYLHINF